MKAFIGTEANHELLALHDLGKVFIVSEQAAFSPATTNDMPQEAQHSKTIRIETFEQSWQQNRDLITQIKTALNAGVVVMKLQEHDRALVGGGVVIGETILDQTVTVSSHDMPEDPNAAGAFNQAIVINFSYEEVVPVNDNSKHLQIRFQRTGALSPTSLGYVKTFKSTYRATRYDEMKNLRSRASGTVVATGEFKANPLDSVDARRSALNAQLATFNAQVNGKDGSLKYGPDSALAFDHVVKVDELDAQMDQMATKIRWSLTAQYTIFPDEAGYAAADFRVDIRTDEETGDRTMTFSGNIAAASEIIALSKLGTLRNAILTANNFSTNNRFRTNQTSSNLSVNDGDAFLNLAFSEEYRVRMSGVTSWNMTVQDQDDITAGMVTRNYSGTVVCSGADANAAFAAGKQRAIELGANKEAFTISSSITRVDRQTKSAGPIENLRVDFQFSYKVKSQRLFLEVNMTTRNNAFGDQVESISGFVTAKDAATANTAYTTYIRAPYASRLVREEEVTLVKQEIGKGTYGATGAFTAGSGRDSMHTGYRFSFSVWKAKAAGTFAFRYKFGVDKDFVNLRQTTNLQGEMYGDEALLGAAADGTAGNKLDQLIALLVPGATTLRSRRERNVEQLGTDITALISISFNEEMVSRITGSSQILQCQLEEDILYSGTRWNRGPNPAGAPSVMQNVGLTEGERTIRGSVMAATETAAMAYVNTVRQMSFPTGTGGAATPTTRYMDPPRIKRSFSFQPLTEGVARGTGANAEFISVEFEFKETVPNLPFVTV